MIQFSGETRKRSLSQLMSMLCHRYPSVSDLQFYDLMKELNCTKLFAIDSNTLFKVKLYLLSRSEGKLLKISTQLS